MAVAAEQQSDRPASALVAALEQAVGLPDFVGPDPSGVVTARRFGRVYAVAVHGGRGRDARVRGAVEEAIAAFGGTPARRDGTGISAAA